jgi:hypothetical protein
MKKLICFFVFSLGITSCSTDSKTTQETKKKNLGLAEKWAWVSTSGGFAGISSTPFSTGKNYILTLKENDSYSLLENGIETANGTYSLTMRESIYNHKAENFITFQNSKFPVGNGIINTDDSKTTMIISDNVYDGFSSSFKKIE